MHGSNRKRSALFTAALATGVTGISANQLYADITLFTTQSDFTGWSGSPNFTVAPTATDLDGSAANGLGNTGGAATPGGLSLSWNSGTFDYIFSQGEAGNPAFLSALGTTGTVFIDYTTPPPGMGNYFQLALVLNYTGAFDQIFPTGGAVNLGGGVSEQAISYTLSNPASSYGYFQLGLIYNSNYNTNTPFTVDNIHIPGTPPPPLGHDAATWTQNGSANWIDTANWTPDIPGGGTGSSATFGTNGGSITTASQILVTLTAPVAVDTITFDKGGGGYKIAGSSSIALNSTATAGVIVKSGNQELAAPLVMSGNNNTFTIATGASLTVDHLSGGGFGFVNVTGGGTLSANAIENVNLVVDGATVNLLPGNAQANAFIYGITVSNGATVNINDATVKNNSLASAGTPGSVHIGAGGVLTTGEFAAFSYTFFGTITGVGSVIIGGDDANQDSVVGFAGNNSYSGSTTITNGSILDVFTPSALGDGSATNTLILDQGTLRAGTPFTSARNVIVNPGSGTIDTNGSNITLGGVAGNGSLTKQGDGQLTVKNVQTGQQLNVNQGSVIIAQNGGSGGAVVLNSLNIGDNNIDTSAKLDLNDNDLILANGGDTSSIRNLLIAGYNGGSWNGNGLTSTYASTHPGTALGYGLAGDLGITSLDGNPINDPNTVIVKYTYYGDSSLDGKVDLGNDFNLFVQGYLGAGTGWEFGDYNYDGSTTSADFGLLIDGLRQQGVGLGAIDDVIAASPLLTATQKQQFLAAVPEPATLSLLAAATPIFLRRRRK
jgi:hypothetical protein